MVRAFAEVAAGAALLLSLLLLSPLSALTFTDTINADFAQGIHENTENVNDDLRLKVGYLQGRFTSRVFDAGQLQVWDTLSWNATLPTLMVSVENDNVGAEPTTLVDGTVRMGRITGGSLLDTRTANGVYENITEEAGAPYGGMVNLILFWDGASIPSGWTCISDDAGEPFYYRFPMGGSTYGSTGGTETHTHSSTSSCGGPSATLQRNSGSAVTTATSTHTHTPTVTVATENHLPPYYDLKVIRYNSGIPSILPAGVIALFPSTSLPPGWSLYTAADNRFLRGAPSAGGMGGNPTHTHSVSVSTGGPSSTVGLATDPCDDSTAYPTSTHTHTGSGTTSSATNLPPYITVVLGKAGSDTPIPGGMIGMFDGIPSGNWTVLPSFNGRFPMENLTAGYGVTGGSSTHNHSDLSITTGTGATASANLDAGTAVTFASGTHTHTVTVSFTESSHLPPYVTVIFAQATCGLRWQQNIENVTTGYSNYQLQVKGKTSGDSENVRVYVWKSGENSWEYVGDLTGTETTLTKNIPASELSSYLSGTSLLVKYESADNTDLSPTTLHVDLCILVEGVLYQSYVKFRVKVSADGSTWSEELGPDGTPNTFFTSSPANLDTIPENRYIRYVAYLSSEHSQLTGANGPKVHDVTITSLTAGQANVFTMEAENVGWESATLTARLLYVDPTAVVRFQYMPEGGTWVSTPWKSWQGSWYWYPLTGLQENKKYYFQAQVRYGGQVYGGGIRTFKTLSSKPYAITLKATEVDNSSAVLNARIYYANYDSVSIRFWYQKDGVWTATPLVSGYRGTTYSYRVTGLTANTLYYFKAEITYDSTSENANVETFTTFSSKTTGMAYDGGMGFGSYPSGWHGVRMTPPSGTTGLKLELLTSSSFSAHHTLRVVRDNGELLYAGHVLSDNGRSKVVSVRFWKSTAGESVYVELYDPYGFAYRTKGTKASLGGATYAYSYLDRAGKNLKYYDRACGVNVLEIYT